MNKRGPICISRDRGASSVHLDRLPLKCAALRVPAKVLAGTQAVVVASSELAQRNRLYICLRCRRYPEGFSAETYQVYRANISEGDRPERQSVSHAFASRSEAEANLRAAGRQWPPAL